MEDSTALKNAGNEAFKQGNYGEAVRLFGLAIQKSPNDHVLYSNRSGAHASLGEWREALMDAEKCVSLNKAFVKGYGRLGLALLNLGRRAEAKKAYEDGLLLDPNNENLRKGLEEINVEDSFISEGRILSVVQSNVKLRGYAEQDPTYVKRLVDTARRLRSDPQMIAELLQPQGDTRIREGLFAMMGLGDMQMPTENMPWNVSEGSTDAEDCKVEEKVGGGNAKVEDKAAAPGGKTVKGPISQADKLKEQGNQYYKARKFDKALEAYAAAIEADPSSSTLQMNRAAVYIELQDYDNAKEACQAALKLATEVEKASCEQLAKIYSRLGLIHFKKEEFDLANEYYEKSLLEDNLPKTRAAHNEVKRAISQKQAKLYEDPEKAEEHKMKGNEFFKQGDYPAAKKEYDEAIRRNPRSAVLYGNRSAAYMKLLEMPSALQDIEKALELDPQYVKGWSRKGNIHMMLKEYNKALAAFDRGLSIDASSAECYDGKLKCIGKIQEAQASGQVDEEQIRQAMKDPEIQSILSDPQFQIILKKITENPESSREYMRDPKIATAISKLVAAGIIRCG